MTESGHPSKRMLGIGPLVAAGVAPGLAWIVLLLFESRLDESICGRRGWFGGSIPLPLVALAATAVGLTIVGAIVLFRSWRSARRSHGKIAETRAVMALVSLISICLFVPLVATSVVRILPIQSC